LCDRSYSSHAIGRIFDFVACNGTLEGSMVEDDDMADAEAVFVDNLPPVAWDSEAWDRDTSVIFDTELLSRDVHPWPIPTVGDDARAEPGRDCEAGCPPVPDPLRDAFLTPEEWDAIEAFEDEPTGEFPAVGIAPIAGGGPEPSEADERWWLERTRP